MVVLEPSLLLVQQHADLLYKIVKPWSEMKDRQGNILMKKIAQACASYHNESITSCLTFIQEIAYESNLQAWITDPVVIFDTTKAIGNAPGIYQYSNEYRDQYKHEPGSCLRVESLRVTLNEFYMDTHETISNPSGNQ